jgi:hypothetical protein
LKILGYNKLKQKKMKNFIQKKYLAIKKNIFTLLSNKNFSLNLYIFLNFIAALLLLISIYLVFKLLYSKSTDDIPLLLTLMKFSLASFSLIILFLYINNKVNIKKKLYISFIFRIIIIIIYLISLGFGISIDSGIFNYFIYFIYFLCFLCFLLFFFKKKNLVEQFDFFILLLFLWIFWWLVYNLIFIGFSFSVAIWPSDNFILFASSFLIYYLDILDNNNFVVDLDLFSIFNLDTNHSSFIIEKSSSLSDLPSINLDNNLKEVNSKYWVWGQGSKFFKPTPLIEESLEAIKFLETSILNLINKLNLDKDLPIPSNFDIILKYFNADLINLSQFNALLKHLIDANALIKFDDLNLQMNFFYLIPRGFRYLYDYAAIDTDWLIVNNTIYLEENFIKNNFKYLDYNFDSKNYLELVIQYDQFLFISNPKPSIEVNLDLLKYGLGKSIYDTRDFVNKPSQIHQQVLYFPFGNKVKFDLNTEESTSLNESNSFKSKKFYSCFNISDLINYTPKIVKIVDIFEENNNWYKLSYSKLNKVFTNYKPSWDSLYNYCFNNYLIWTNSYENTSYFINRLPFLIPKFSNELNLLNFNLDKFEASNIFCIIDMLEEKTVLNKIRIGLEDFLGIKHYNLSESELNLCKIYFIKFWFTQIYIFNPSWCLTNDSLDSQNMLHLNWYDINIIYQELLENILYVQCKLFESLWCMNYMYEVKLLGFSERDVSYEDLKSHFVDSNLIDFYNDLYFKYKSEVLPNIKAYDIRLKWVWYKTNGYNINIFSLLEMAEFIKKFDNNIKLYSNLSQDDLSKRVYP